MNIKDYSEDAIEERIGIGVRVTDYEVKDIGNGATQISYRIAPGKLAYGMSIFAPGVGLVGLAAVEIAVKTQQKTRLYFNSKGIKCSSRHQALQQSKEKNQTHIVKEQHKIDQTDNNKKRGEQNQTKTQPKPKRHSSESEQSQSQESQSEESSQSQSQESEQSQESQDQQDRQQYRIVYRKSREQIERQKEQQFRLEQQRMRQMQVEKQINDIEAKAYQLLNQQRIAQAMYYYSEVLMTLNYFKVNQYKNTKILNLLNSKLQYLFSTNKIQKAAELFLLLKVLQQRLNSNFNITLSQSNIFKIISILYQKADDLFQKEDYIHAEQLFTLIYQLNQDEILLQKIQTAKTEIECLKLNQQAFAYEQSKNLRKATQIYSEIIRLTSSNFMRQQARLKLDKVLTQLNNEGENLFENQKYKQALELFKFLKRVGPSDENLQKNIQSNIKRTELKLTEGNTTISHSQTAKQIDFHYAQYKKNYKSNNYEDAKLHIERIIILAKSLKFTHPERQLKNLQRIRDYEEKLSKIVKILNRQAINNKNSIENSLHSSQLSIKHSANQSYLSINQSMISSESQKKIHHQQSKNQSDHDELNDNSFQSLSQVSSGNGIDEWRDLNEEHKQIFENEQIYIKKHQK